MSNRDPRDLSQYVVLKHRQAALFGALLWVSGVLAGLGIAWLPW